MSQCYFAPVRGDATKFLSIFLTLKKERLLLCRLTQMFKYIEFKSIALKLVKLFLASGIVERVIQSNVLLPCYFNLYA